jgi:hypothetical protein
VRWYVSWRQKGVGKVAGVGPMQIDAFDIDDRLHAGFQDGKRLDVRYPVLVVEEAIVGEPSRHPAPSLK